MGLPIGKRDISAVAKVLTEPHDSAEDAAAAVLKVALEIFSQKAKFVVVGQLKWSGGKVTDSEKADKVALGPYATRSEAQSAGKQLAFSTKTNEEFRWWMLEVWPASPDKFYAARRDARLESEKKPLPELPPTWEDGPPIN